MTEEVSKAPKMKLAADQFAESLLLVVEQAREGITSHDCLADYLTEQGIPTATGLPVWGHDLKAEA